MAITIESMLISGKKVYELTAKELIELSKDVSATQRILTVIEDEIIRRISQG